jgi:hypothetical protein
MVSPARGIPYKKFHGGCRAGNSDFVIQIAKIAGNFAVNCPQSGTIADSVPARVLTRSARDAVGSVLDFQEASRTTQALNGFVL